MTGLVPVWTPDDFAETVAAAHLHQRERGEQVPPTGQWSRGVKRSRFVYRTWHVRQVRRLLALVAAGFVLAATGALWAGEARADTLSGCETVPWGFLGSSQRSVCDGALRADGSWLRAREFWTPAHNVPLTTYCSGGIYYSSCSTSGGYFQPRTSKGVETYVVTPDTVLPDEPGHLVNSEVA